MKPFHDPTSLFVDNSFIELITACPWKGFASGVLRRRLSSEQPALRFGGHIHAALAYRYRMEAFGKQWSEDIQTRILSTRFGATPCETEDWRNLENAQAVIHAYNEKYLLETFDIQTGGPHNLPMVERPFACVAGEVRGRKIIYTGRIDLLIRDGQQCFVVDHKTTSMLGDSYWKDLQMSEQQRGYCWAMREVTGEEPTGYLMNILACRKPTKTGKAIEFARQRFFTKVPPDQLDEWHANMLDQVDMFLYHYERGCFPRYHSGHCVHKYGECQFYKVCELPPASRDAALASSAYTDNTWTPLYK
jgi:hypothetical protein